MYAQKGTSPIAILEGLRNADLDLMDYIDRLEEHFNAVEPHVLAFVPEPKRFERLREEARDLIEQYPDPEDYPPLFGLLVGVKDIFHTDGFMTQAGSQLPAGALQGEEAEVVTRVKELGALIIGKTVTTEFAYFAPGPTRNPHNPNHTPGGSSSGSAAAVAAGLASLAFGTQTIGSISRPASFCGVVGFKPSYDRLSKAGVIPLSQSLDHVGVFAPDLATIRLYARHCLPEFMPGDGRMPKPVVAVPEGPYLKKADSEMLEQFERTVSKLSRRDFEVKSIPAFADIDDIIARHELITAAEAAKSHAQLFDDHRQAYHPRTRDLILFGRQIDEEQLKEARMGRLKLRDQLLALMLTEGIDVWITPSAPGAAPQGLSSTGDPVLNLPWTHAGLPTLSIPMGLNPQGLPLGLQLAGSWYGDERLIDYGPMVQAAIR